MAVQQQLHHQTKFPRLNTFLATHPCDEPNAAQLRWLAKATDLAITSEFPIFRLAAILVDSKGRMISFGTNSRKTHPMQAQCNEHSNRLHAEILTIVRAAKSPMFRPYRNTMIVSRIDRSGNPSCSYPCRNCLPALIDEEVGVNTIICFDELGKPVRINLNDGAILTNE